MTDLVFEAPSNCRPRDCPPICLFENLPSFPEQKDARQWGEKWGGMTIHCWLCKECLHWHIWSVGADPGGHTSGTTRTQKHVEEIKAEFFRKRPYLKELTKP